MRSGKIQESISNQRGQLVVEYVLLLVIAVSIAIVITTKLIKRDSESPENSGAIILKWRSMQQEIGKDQP